MHLSAHTTVMLAADQYPISRFNRSADSAGSYPSLSRKHRTTTLHPYTGSVAQGLRRRLSV